MFGLPMAPILQFRKLCYLELGKFLSFQTQKIDERGVIVANSVKDEKKMTRRTAKGWRCIDNCCWIIGYICTTWWILLLSFHCLPATLPGFQVPESPGTRLKCEGFTPLHPVVMVPGIITGGLELWEGKPCAEGLFRKRLWGGSFTEVLKRPFCWLEHLSLDNETGLDPPCIRVRAVQGLIAADYFAPGYFVWAVLIENLAKIGYEGKNMHMAAYDWRLAFQNTENRDQALSRLKSRIQLLHVTNGYKKVVVVPHSMGALYFLHFLKWVEALPPVGGGGGPGWCDKHIKAVMNIGPTFLGVPKAVTTVFSGKVNDVSFVRAMDSELFGFQTFEHMIRVTRTWDSILSLMPKGGEAIWGDLDWSPEEGHHCNVTKKRSEHTFLSEKTTNSTDVKSGFYFKDSVKYGRIISFGTLASQLPPSLFPSLDTKELFRMSSDKNFNTSCGEVWTEYDEMSRESIQKVAENKAHTARTLIDLVRLVAPKMMRRADAHFSHGIADNLDDPKHAHYKYWSNPLETKLPNAPEMEIYCMYGVGIPTERSYVYNVSPNTRCKSIPFRIDSSVDGEKDSCLRDGVHFVDGDETVPVVSAGFMCAKGWRGRTRFNPSGAATYVREYRHKPPSSLLDRRGIESGGHVDIMGNVALIEDIMRVATGATGAEIGGDSIHSELLRVAEKINLQL